MTEALAQLRSVELESSPDGAAKVLHAPTWLSAVECQEAISVLTNHAAEFEGGFHLVDGKPSPTPRRVLAFGDGSYLYPDIGECLPWPSALLAVRSRLSDAVGQTFNYALVNWYRDGNDFTGWHADKIDLHKPDTEIAIVSLGATRELVFRRIGQQTPVAELPLTEGSLLLMDCALQRRYEHAIPVREGERLPRWSITFRDVLEPVEEVAQPG